MKSGYFGIAIYASKCPENVGTLYRTALIMGASFVATVGHRYKAQPSDTPKSKERIPFFEFDTIEDLKKSLPLGCPLIGIELHDRARYLNGYGHPDKACYLLGAEDFGIPESEISKCDSLIKLQGRSSMNVAVAGSIVIYHRQALYSVNN